MKRSAIAGIARRSAAGDATNNLIAIGSDIILCGEFLGGDKSEWRIKLQAFVDGDRRTILGLAQARPASRYSVPLREKAPARAHRRV